jgi:hypothetical protein
MDVVVLLVFVMIFCLMVWQKVEPSPYDKMALDKESNFSPPPSGMAKCFPFDCVACP